MCTRNQNFWQIIRHKTCVGLTQAWMQKAFRRARASGLGTFERGTVSIMSMYSAQILLGAYKCCLPDLRTKFAYFCL